MDLTEKEREARRLYLREWRKRNQDKVRKHNQNAQKRYWEKKAKEIEEREKQAE